MRFKVAVALVCAALVWSCGRDAPPAPAEPAAVVAAEPALDPVSGLRMTGDWELVRATCSGCHSTRLITNQRGSAEQWVAMIRWMQEKQNLWEFAPSVEERIVNYLAENYPPGASQRRAALSPDLMPPNPYAP